MDRVRGEGGGLCDANDTNDAIDILELIQHYFVSFVGNNRCRGICSDTDVNFSTNSIKFD